MERSPQRKLMNLWISTRFHTLDNLASRPRSLMRLSFPATQKSSNGSHSAHDFFFFLRDVWVARTARTPGRRG